MALKRGKNLIKKCNEEKATKKTPGQVTTVPTNDYDDDNDAFDNFNDARDNCEDAYDDLQL